MKKVASRCGALALLMAVAACAPSVPAADPFGGAGNSSGSIERISFSASNYYDEDVVLYAVSANGAHRLGEVAPNQHGMFSMPWTGPTELRVRVQILAGPRYTTNSLSVYPGHQLEVVIPSNVRRARISRR